MAFKKTMAPIRILIVLAGWHGNLHVLLDFAEPSALGTLWNGGWDPFSPLHY